MLVHAILHHLLLLLLLLVVVGSNIYIFLFVDAAEFKIERVVRNVEINTFFYRFRTTKIVFQRPRLFLSRMWIYSVVEKANLGIAIPN